MTSIVQPPQDINKDPFIVQGKEIIDSLYLEVATICRKSLSNENEWIWADSIYVYIPMDSMPEIYNDFFGYAFQYTKEYHAPTRIFRYSKYQFTLFFKHNFRFENQEVKSHFWDKDATEKETKRMKSYLNSCLINFYNDNLTF